MQGKIIKLSLFPDRPSYKFTDGTKKSDNGFVYLDVSYKKQVVTVGLRHLGVYISTGYFPKTKILNLSVKFIPYMDNTQQKMPNRHATIGLSPLSLCKFGCPSREYHLEEDLEFEGDTLENPCNKLISYYRLSCLYDTLLFGFRSILPHIFANSFDNPHQIDFPDVTMVPPTPKYVNSTHVPFNGTVTTHKVIHVSPFFIVFFLVALILVTFVIIFVDYKQNFAK